MSIIHVQKEGKDLKISVTLDRNLYAPEIWIESERNTAIARMSDLSACTPIPQRLDYGHQQEIWFPVVDVLLNESLFAIAQFAGWEQHNCCLNEMMGGKKEVLSYSMHWPETALEHWENAVWIDSRTVKMTRFALCQKLDPQCDSLVLKLLSEKWAGTVTLYDRTPDGLVFMDRAAVWEAWEENVIPTKDNLDTENLTRALNDTLSFLFRALNDKKDSQTRGGINLFYDFDAKTFRTSHWVWTWGIVIRLFLSAAQSGIPLRYTSKELINAALKMGETSLRFQAEAKNEPEDGVVCVRQDLWPSVDYEYHGCYSHADSMFLAGYGWIPLYEQTGDSRYLDAAQRILDAIERTNSSFPIIPQDYYQKEKKWAPHGINESGFGMKGLSQLCRICPTGHNLEVTREYMRQHMQIYQLENGLWNRYYHFSDNRIEPCNFWTRGMGWGMISLLSAVDVFPEEDYLLYAEKMAAQLMEYQDSSGCWAHQFNSSISDTGACEKSTSLWCMLFYELYAKTRNLSYLHTAQKALKWCLSHQYQGIDPDACGSLIGCSMNSGIVYRNWFNMACAYSSAFFGLALLAELSLFNPGNSV